VSNQKKRLRAPQRGTVVRIQQTAYFRLYLLNLYVKQLEEFFRALDCREGRRVHACKIAREGGL